MIRFAAQPAEKGALEQLGIQAIRLCSAVLARNWDAGWMDDVNLDVMSAQPAC